MKLKTVEIDGKTYAEVTDGKPVYMSDGKEVAFDAPHTAATITRLNGEAKGHRERAEAAEKKLDAFSGIEDPEAAIDALRVVKNLDDKKLVDAGEVDRLKQAAIEATEAKFKPFVEKATKLEQALNAEMIGGSFARSKFIAENVAVPPDLIQAQFGSHFSVEDGKLIAKDANGSPIYSKERPGEPAGFDDAIQTLIEAYPHKDAILKGRQQNGAGAKPATGAGAGKTISRADFNSMAPKQRAATMADGYTITD